jgi:hypothetical protein
MIDWLRSHPALSSYRLAPLGVLLVFLGAAAAGGVVVASGNLVLIGLAVGAIVGTLLLNAAGFVVWTVVVGTLLVAGPLAMHIPALGRIQWIFSVMGFLLIGAAILHAGADRDVRRGPMPAFVLFALLFMTYAIAMLFVSDGSVAQAASAIKRYFQYYGLMFALATIAFVPRKVLGWLRFLLVLGLVQLPFALYQFLVLVPQRQNMPRSVVPIDIVVGTFEGQIDGGGNSNAMVFFVVLMGAGILALYREALLKGWRLPVALGLCLAPLGIGETKTAVVLLPLALLVIFIDNVKRRPFAFATGAVAAGILTAGLGYLYLVGPAVSEGRTMSLQRAIETNLEYNVGNQGYLGGTGLNRSNVIPFWWSQHVPRDLPGLVGGHGLGSTAQRTGAMGESGGEMDRRYPGMYIGLTTASTLLWDLGVVGFGLYMLMIGAAIVSAIGLVRKSAPGFDRAFARTLLAGAVLLVPMVFHSDMMIVAPSMQVLTAFLLGLIAWRARVPTRPAA